MQPKPQRLAVPPSGLSRLTEIGIMLFPLAAGWGSGFIALSLFMQLQRSGRVTFRHPVAWLLGVISLGLLGVTAIAAYPVESLLGLANFLPFFLLFLVYGQMLNTVARLERLAWLLVVPSLVVSLVGLGELGFGWQTPQIVWQFFGWELTGVGNPAGRLASSFMYANTCAAYLLMALMLAFGLWFKRVLARDVLRSSAFWYLSLTVIVDLAALVLTNSRNAWAIAGLGILAYAFYVGWWWICAFAGGLVTAVLGASFGQTPWRESLRAVVPYYFWGRLSDQMYQGRPTADLRVTQWQFVLDMIRQRPLTGWGLRSFTPAYEAAMQTWLGHPHNLYLMLLSEMGLPLGGLFIGTIGWIYAQGVLTWQKLTQNADQLLIFSYLMAFGSYMLFNTLDVTLLDLRLNTFAWLLLAAIWGLGQQINQPGNERQDYGSPEEDQGNLGTEIIDGIN